jgi:hypothetical protein
MVMHCYCFGYPSNLILVHVCFHVLYRYLVLVHDLCHDHVPYHDLSLFHGQHAHVGYALVLELLQVCPPHCWYS